MRLNRILSLLLSLGFSVGSHGIEQEEQLKFIREQIKGLNDQIGTQAVQRDKLRTEIQNSEAQIAKIRAVLADTLKRRTQTQKEFRELSTQLKEAKNSILQTQERISQILFSQYVSQEEILTERTVSDRYVIYDEYLNQAQNNLFKTLRLQQASLESLLKEINSRQRILKKLEIENTEQANKLKIEKRKHETLLAQIQKDINEKSSKVSLLKKEEERLNDLISEIDRTQTNKPNKLIGKEEITKLATFNPNKPFSSFKGTMPVPISGRIIVKFNDKKLNDGDLWKGIFYESELNQPVKVIADGQIYYSSWNRGLGNIIIVDHGNNYLSLYGNIQNPKFKVGAKVKMGQVIAFAARSDRREVNGLYFEIRR